MLLPTKWLQIALLIAHPLSIKCTQVRFTMIQFSNIRYSRHSLDVCLFEDNTVCQILKIKPKTMPITKTDLATEHAAINGSVTVLVLYLFYSRTVKLPFKEAHTVFLYSVTERERTVALSLLEGCGHPLKSKLYNSSENMFLEAKNVKDKTLKLLKIYLVNKPKNLF